MLSAVIIFAFVLMMLAPCVLALINARTAKSARAQALAVASAEQADLSGNNAHLALAARAQQARSIANRASVQLGEAIAAANSVHGDSVSLSNKLFAARSRAQLAERLAVAAEAAASIAASRAAIGRANTANARAEQAQQLARQTASELHSIRASQTPRPAVLAAGLEAAQDRQSPTAA